MTPRERNMSDIELIALRHGLTRDDVIADDRRPHVVAARQDCALHFRKMGKSYPEIGRILDRHHTSIMNLIQKATA